MTVVNHGSGFERCFREINSLELELKKNDINMGFFLNLGIRTKDNRFSIRLYEKSDDLSFSVNRIPYLCSNILSKTEKIWQKNLGATSTTSACNKILNIKVG